MSRKIRYALAAAAFAAVALPAGAQQRSGKEPAAGDSAAAVATVNQLHALLEQGDSAGVLALLTDDVAILESGGYENRAEFRSHHLPADIAYARAVKSERQLRSVKVIGDAAWVSSTSTAQGEYRGRQINSAGAELMVLARTPGGWKISAIHWSSRARRPAGG